MDSEPLPIQIAETAQKVDFKTELKAEHPILLPNLSNLPSEYQERSRKSLAYISQFEERASVVEPKVEKERGIVKDIRARFDGILAENPAEEEVHNKAEELTEAIITEIQALVKIKDRLQTSMDAVDLIGSSQFDSRDVYRYGKAKDIVQAAKQALWKRGTDYEKGKQDFIQSQWRRFITRRDNLSQIVRDYVGAKVAEANLPEIRQCDVSADSFSEDIENVKTAADAYAETYETQHLESATKTEVLEDVRKRLETDQRATSNLSSEGDPPNAPIGANAILRSIKFWQGELGKNDERVKMQLKGYDWHLLQQEIIIINQMEETSNAFLGNIKKPEFYIGDPRENRAKWAMFDSLQYAGTTQEEFAALERVFYWFNDYLAKYGLNGGKSRQNLEFAAKILHNLSELNRTFGEGNDLMWHQAPLEVLLQKIIVPGELMSRATQMEKYGEAVFSTAGMKARKIGEDKYELTEETSYGPTRNVVNEKELGERRLSQKRWFQEYNQIVFSGGFPYAGDNVESALCFSAESLLENRQFMVSDGWHVFDGQYSGIPDSVGFQLDLAKEPHMLVLIKEGSLPQVKEMLNRLSKDGKVLGSTLSIDEWIEKNVMVVDSLVGEATKIKVEQEFAYRFPRQPRQGFFMPSGINAPEKPGVIQPQPLLTYKST